MVRIIAVLFALATLLASASAAPVPQPKTFLVEDGGLAFIGSDGKEKERLDPQAGNGALSPDGQWLAYVAFDADSNRTKLVIRPRGRQGEPVTVPLVWDAVGTGCLPVWAADSKRVLIGENRSGKNGALEYAYRVYELATKKLTELKLPNGHWVTGWSSDGKRFVTTAQGGDDAIRIALLNADGADKPEFITPAAEVAFGARLSPDGRRVLFQAGPRAAKGEPTRMRLYAMDLKTKKRTAVDEPGETHGYCWSPDGSKVAYTWQRSLDNPAEVAGRETVLITCDADGKNRKTLTNRKYEVPENSSGRSGVVIFFEVRDWR
jgi:Tol biopolymer transport system component